MFDFRYNKCMRKLLLPLLLLTSLYADDDIALSFALRNSTPYQNEGILLDLNITQIDDSKVMLFKFNPVENVHYKSHQIAFKENEAYHHLKQQYQYLIYPKTKGEVKIAFELIKSITDDDKVAYAISGDRDNVKGLVKQDIAVAVDPISLEVKALSDGVDLVGNYTLNYKLDSTTTDAYDPIHLHIELQGQGACSTFAFIPERPHYHLFTQEPKQRSFHTTKGTSTKIIWDYALSAKEDFVLPKVVLNAFDPKTEQSYQLIFPEHKIKVNAVPSEKIVDKEDYPPSNQSDWSWLGWLFSYLMIFVAGYLTPRDLLKRKVIKERTPEEILKDQIRGAKSHKELLKLLLNANQDEYQEAIHALESVIYHKKKVSLSQIKGRLA